MEQDLKLRELIERAKNGDQEALERIIYKFNPLIKKMCRDLGYDEAYSDLVLWVVNAVHRYIPATGTTKNDNLFCGLNKKQNTKGN